MKLDAVLSGLGLKLNLGALTLDKVVHVLLLILVGVVVIRVFLKLLDRVLARSKSLKSLSRYIHSVAKISMAFILVLMVAEDVGIHTTSLVAMLSVAGLAVSLALQNTLSNVAGGIMLLVTTPFQVGDYVEADGISGTVHAIDLSYTAILTIDGKEIFVPNSQLSGTKIINYTILGRRRVDLNFTASYDAPTAPAVCTALSSSSSARCWRTSPRSAPTPRRRSTCPTIRPAASSMWCGPGPPPPTIGRCTTPSRRGSGRPLTATGWR